MRGILRLGATLAGALALSACASTPPFDYSIWLQNPPRSILVLPPIDNTIEPLACYGCLSTVTQPLAERGFYVFPVAVVDAMMRENGLPTPNDMHSVPLAKLREIFAPDAVLYLTVSEWGTSYQVVSSVSSVAIAGRLVDARTGTEIWRGQHRLAQGSGGGGNLIGMLASALVTQVARSVNDPSRQLSSVVSGEMFANPRNGLLPGPYHDGHEAALTAERDAMAARAAAADGSP
ncbi:MAG: GNA1162 family protein [Planctomycetota bacterium]